MTELGVTPSQTAGPFLRIGMMRELLPHELVDAGDPRAIRIRGRVVDGAGDGVPDGGVEIWQANAAGRYRHASDDREDVPLEDRFDGFGRSSTENDGWFELVTVKPGAVPWPEGGLQAPHVGVCVLARGLLKAVFTRMYFPDEADANERDPVLSRLSAAERETLVAVPESGGLRFDVRLQGPGQTTFFAA